MLLVALPASLPKLKSSPLFLVLSCFSVILSTILICSHGRLENKNCPVSVGTALAASQSSSTKK